MGHGYSTLGHGYSTLGHGIGYSQGFGGSYHGNIGLYGGHGYSSPYYSSGIKVISSPSYHSGIHSGIRIGGSYGHYGGSYGYGLSSHSGGFGVSLGASKYSPLKFGIGAKYHSWK